ncbi:hypothetical protein BJ170DRAFT_598810 [Xylariales sp. AK1849]|nr:hypothetical protein BJ170DRAFT_598810 [Xylariales sp. AK1849]
MRSLRVGIRPIKPRARSSTTAPKARETAATPIHNGLGNFAEAAKVGIFPSGEAPKPKPISEPKVSYSDQWRISKECLVNMHDVNTCDNNGIAVTPWRKHWQGLECWKNYRGSGSDILQAVDKIGYGIKGIDVAVTLLELNPLSHCLKVLCDNCDRIDGVVDALGCLIDACLNTLQITGFETGFEPPAEAVSLEVSGLLENPDGTRLPSRGSMMTTCVVSKPC